MPALATQQRNHQRRKGLQSVCRQGQGGAVRRLLLEAAVSLLLEAKPECGLSANEVKRLMFKGMPWFRIPPKYQSWRSIPRDGATWFGPHIGPVPLAAFLRMPLLQNDGSAAPANGPRWRERTRRYSDVLWVVDKRLLLDRSSSPLGLRFAPPHFLNVRNGARSGFSRFS
jgi:hypothetical protein